jgi:very-short-patch-repair endonuclease
LETRLWHALRAKRFNGAKFRQQVVVGRYIVDFACPLPKMLIVEVDGDTHGSQQAYDERRTAFLHSRGYQVLRFTNHDVGTNIEGVLTTIAAALQPSPLQGRGKSGEAAKGEGQCENSSTSPLSPALSPEGERQEAA